MRSVFDIRVIFCMTLCIPNFPRNHIRPSQLPECLHVHVPTTATDPWFHAHALAVIMIMVMDMCIAELCSTLLCFALLSVSPDSGGPTGACLRMSPDTFRRSSFRRHTRQETYAICTRDQYWE